jgi:hypothetical protein
MQDMKHHFLNGFQRPMSRLRRASQSKIAPSRTALGQTTAFGGSYISFRPPLAPLVLTSGMQHVLIFTIHSTPPCAHPATRKAPHQQRSFLKSLAAMAATFDMGACNDTHRVTIHEG